MKEVTTKFKCDYKKCRNSITIDTTNGKHYPYDKGWVYMYTLSLKVESDVKEGLRDMHFCSMKCMEKSLLNYLEELEIKED